MRVFFAILFFLVGIIIMSITVHSMGYLGNAIIKIIGFGLIFFGGFIARKLSYFKTNKK